jgi:hypothetical protein
MKCIVTLVAIGLLSGTVGAQQKPSLQVLVEELDPDARICGLSKSSIEPIAMLTLRNNGIHVVPMSNPFLYVHATVLVMRRGSEVIGCAVSSRVDVRALLPQKRLSGVKSRGSMAATVLCETSSLMSGPSSGMESQYFNSLEQDIKLCLGKLDY